MKKERNIGQEILAGIKEIKEWQQGKKKLKTTYVQFPRINKHGQLNDKNYFRSRE